MFKFLKDDHEPEVSEEKCENVVLEPAEEILINQLHYDIREKVPCNEYKLKLNNKETNTCLKYIIISHLLRSDFVTKDNEKVKSILSSTSDLTSGVYEGGFKIWECTFDLIKYLAKNKDQIPLGESTRTLDLGCGSGLLGLYALSKGAFVDFQDYNAEVLNYLTIPNTMLNSTDEVLTRCRYFSGDWSRFQQLLEDRGEKSQYDMILSSETIYNLDYLPKFFRLIKSCLKPGGSLYLAAKTCYFGVGGGTRAFCNLLKEDSTSWKHEIVEVLRDGIQREIIKVTLL